MTLKELLTNTTDNALEMQQKNGAFPAGHNGPYKDPESPIRVTSHWLITLIRLAEQSDRNNRWDEPAQKAYTFLLENTKWYSENGFYICRLKEGRDVTNGLIGQAWVIEGLIMGSEYFRDEAGRERAFNVYRKHKFDKKQGLWHRIDSSGSAGRIDQTFNHQLWFAACSAPLIKYYPHVIDADITRFIDRLNKNIFILPEGLIWHEIPYKADFRSRLGHLLNQICTLSSGILGNYDSECKKINKTNRLYLKSAGYHAFNLYAFVRLREIFSDYAFWSSDKFRRAVNYLDSDEYKYLLKAENTYGYPYNAPGFEIPFIKYMICHSSDFKAGMNGLSYIEEQIQQTFNSESYLFDRGNPDPKTLTARIYELSRIPWSLLGEIEI